MSTLVYKKIQTRKISSNFKDATEIVSVTRSAKVTGDDKALVKIIYTGINASDVNYTAGRYSPKHTKAPFDCGFEAIGQVVDLGSAAGSVLKIGDYVLVWQYGCFAEYMEVDAKKLARIPKPLPEFMSMMSSGLTASIALSEIGELRSGQTVLVTAAAGATGSFAVQLAKIAGNTVIGTCSSEDKVQYLKSIGCDRAINYKKEDLNKVLTAEFPKGVDIVYESVGGATFDTCMKHLAQHGRLIIVGLVSQYADQSAFTAAGAPKLPLAPYLLSKSASVRGFFLPHYMHLSKAHGVKLMELFQSGKLKVTIDKTPFAGLEQVADAVDYLYQGKNFGKVVVNLSTFKSKL